MSQSELSRIRELKKKLLVAEKLATGQMSKAEAHRLEMASRSRDKYATEAEIGDIPHPADPSRRESCRCDLYRFLVTYFPHSTGLGPFSEDHTDVIADIQSIIVGGGRRVNAVYREFAKTTISENSILWAMLYGYRRFALLTAVNQAASAGNVDSLKAELSQNELLYEDFPEVCYPIWALEGKPQRCASQTHHGNRTLITWRAETIVLPTIEGSIASGAIIIAKPFAKARGVKFKRPDGAQARPDLIMADDIQDDDSAASPGQVVKNLKILKKNLLHTSGHRQTAAVIVNGTVIAKNDMMESLLEDTAWQGRRIPFVKHLAAAHDTFWMKDYATVRRSFDKAILGDRERAHREATALYMARRAEADEGCVVSWAERYTQPVEVSAIQHAYNVMIDDGAEVFASEYQNEPLDDRLANSKLTAALVASKTNGLARGVAPRGSHHVVAYIDVHGRVLYYALCAFAQDFSVGSVIDYGTYPRQPVSYFSQSTAPRTMESVFRSTSGMATQEAWIHAGLERLTSQLLCQKTMNEDGSEMQIGRLLIDARWGETNTLVKTFCRRHSSYPNVVFPAQGYGTGPSRPPLRALPLKPGTREGQDWRILPQVGGERWVTIDTNAWKTFVCNRLALPLAQSGGIDLFGVDPREHSLFADHCVSEAPEEVFIKSRDITMQLWGQPVADNHWWDCLVGCAVAASMLGCSAPEDSRTRKKKQRLALSQLAVRK